MGSSSLNRTSNRQLGPALFAIACAAAAPAWSAIYTVGAGVDCSAHTVANALLLAIVNPGADTIRIARDQTYTSQHVVVDNQSVTLEGGYDTCADATADPATPTVLSGLGGSANPVVAISNSSGATTTVDLLNLTVQQGEQGGLVISGDVQVEANYTSFDANNGVNGGGIAIDGAGGAVLTLGLWSEVGSNHASGSGGGVYCTNGGRIRQWGAIASNLADAMGGGLYLDGCTLDAYGGPFSLIQANHANLGGGIYATGGAAVSLLGDGTFPIVVFENQATGDGGGLHLSGAATAATVHNSEVVGNSATGNGGGFSVSGGATLLMERDGSSCSRGARCSLLEFNACDWTARGGAIAVTTGGQADIRQTHVAFNGTDQFGGVAWVDGAGSALRLEGVTLYGNEPELNEQCVLNVENGAFLRLAYVSSAKNRVWPPATLVCVGANTDVELLSSVVVEIDGGPVLSPPGAGATAVVDCVITHESASLPPGATIVLVVTDPLDVFVAPAFGNLHLRAGSPAIDYCDTQVYPPVDADIDNEARGQDDLSLPNGLGPYDIGADERVPLFRDGFETGDTSGWSLAVP